MGWLSNIFGSMKSGTDKQIDAIFSNMVKILDDEKFQIEMLPEPIQEIIRSKAPCDEKAGASGQFGMSVGNPIPTNGPVGELAYLSRLRTSAGESLFFHRIGSQGSIDVFEAVSTSGSEWFIFFLDMYYPRRSRKAPEGFKIFSQPSQFSGFTKFCSDFPRDFSEAKQSDDNSALSFGYIALSKAQSWLANGSFERPLSHRAKMDIVRSELSGVLT